MFPTMSAMAKLKPLGRTAMTAGAATSAYLLAALLVSLSTGTGAAAYHATPGRYLGYTFTDVTPRITNLQDLSLDSCAMLVAAADGNLTRVREIYYDGAFAKPLAFATLAGAKPKFPHNAPLYAMLFSGVSWSSPADLIQEFEGVLTRWAFDPRTGTRETVVFSQRGKIMFDLLDEAIASPSRSGKLHAVDAAWAMLSGKPGVYDYQDPSAGCPDSMFTIYSYFDDVFGDAYRTVPYRMMYMAQAFGDAQYAAARNNSTAVREAALTIASVYAEFALQFMQYDRLAVDLGDSCNSYPMSRSGFNQGLNLLNLTKAVLKGLGSSDAGIQALDVAVRNGPNLAALQAAIKAVINGTGIALSDIHTPDPAAEKAKWIETQGINITNCTATD